MADVLLNVKIVDAKVAKAVEGFLKIYPNTEKDENGDPKYATTKAWVEEWLSRILIRDIKRGLQMLRNESVATIEDMTDAVTPQ